MWLLLYGIGSRHTSTSSLLNWIRHVQLHIYRYSIDILLFYYRSLLIIVVCEYVLFMHLVSSTRFYISLDWCIRTIVYMRIYASFVVVSRSYILVLNNITTLIVYIDSVYCALSLAFIYQLSRFAELLLRVF